MTDTATNVNPVNRTSAGLRDALFDELDRIRGGDTNATRANAISRLADQICNTVHMELEVHRHLAKVPDSAVKLPEPLTLSAPVVPE
jgi:uncharacterized protein related to proFAR isomerase